MTNRFNPKSLFLAIHFTSLVILTVLPNMVEAKNCRQYRIDQSIEAKALWQDISILSSDKMQGRKTQTPGASLARDYIQQRFREIGLVAFANEKSEFTGYLAPFIYQKSLSQIKGINVVGYLPGIAESSQYIVITAHYDHLGEKANNIYNGADDNASGVGAMLAIATMIKSSPTRNSVIFLATDAEEQGLYGAKAFVQNPPVKLSQLKYNLNLDMLSQGGRRNRLYVSGAGSNDSLRYVVAEAIKSAGLCLQRGHRSSRKGYAGINRMNWRGASDHAAFSRVKIPFLFVGVSDHSYYHTEQDTVEHVDREFYTAATEASLQILRLMDSVN